MTWKERGDREREPGAAPENTHHWEPDKGATSGSVPSELRERKGRCDVRAEMGARKEEDGPPLRNRLRRGGTRDGLASRSFYAEVKAEARLECGSQTSGRKENECRLWVCPICEMS